MPGFYYRNGLLCKPFDLARAGFNPQHYQYWVRDSFRGQPRDFEEVVRKYLAGQKVRQQVLAPIAEDKREAQWLGWMSSLMTTARFEDYTNR